MWLAVRYRRAQAIALAALACVMTGCAVLAPLYDRAMQQALTRLTVDAAPSNVTAVRLRGEAPEPDRGKPVSPPSHAALAALVPAPARPWFHPPIDSTSLLVVQQRAGGAFPDRPVAGELLWRDGACTHLKLSSGRCPTGPGEVAVSAADVTNFGLTVGTAVDVLEQPLSQPDLTLPGTRIRVTGVYRQIPGEFWDGTLLTGVSGFEDPLPPNHRLHDVWVTGRATFAGPGAPRWIGPQNLVDFNVDRSALDVDRLATAGPVVAGILERAAEASTSLAAGDPTTLLPAKVESGLPAIADVVREGRRQARLTVPLLMVQLGLLALFVLWLVLGVAVEQRRPETAVARLRGSGRRGARRLVVAELLPVALVGVPLGAAAAVGLCTLARRTVLRGRAPFELPGSVWIAVALAVLVVTGTIWLSASRGTAGGVASLLRRVPPRSPTRTPDLADVVLASASGGVVLAFTTGGLSGPLALAAPALLALAVGLVLAYLIGPAVTWLGRRLLDRGRYAAAAGLLATARRPATRRVVTVVAVASSLLVFSADALTVGVRNRQLAAERDVGAATVADLTSNDVGTVRRAVASLADRHVTTVVRMQPAGEAFVVSLAVVPAEFRRVALLPDAPRGLPWDRLAPTPGRPITLSGSSVSIRVRPVDLRINRRGSYLQLELVDGAGREQSVELGEIRTGPARTLTAGIPCRPGCVVAGITIRSLPGVRYGGRLVLDRVRTVGGSTLLPGRVDDWSATGAPGQDNRLEPIAARAGRLTLRLTGADNDSQTMVSRGVSTRLPSILGGPDVDLSLPNIYGNTLGGPKQLLAPVAVLPRAPGLRENAAIVNLDMLQRRGTHVSSSARIEVWLDDENDARLERVRSALRASGVEIRGVRRVSQARAAYDASVPAWSLQLALFTAVISLLFAALVIVVLVISTWRLRSRDLAGLGISGVPPAGLRRMAVAEQVPVVVLAALVGAYCGLVGAVQALPSVPLFATPVPRSSLVFEPQWPTVIAVLAGELVILVAVGWLSARAVVGRAGLDRVRQTL